MKTTDKADKVKLLAKILPMGIFGMLLVLVGLWFVITLFSVPIAPLVVTITDWILVVAIGGGLVCSFGLLYWFFLMD